MQSSQSVIELLDSSSEEENNEKPIATTLAVRRKSSRTRVATKFLGFSDSPHSAEQNRIKKEEIIFINSDSSDEDDDNALFDKTSSCKQKDSISQVDILCKTSGKRKNLRKSTMPKRLGFVENPNVAEFGEKKVGGIPVAATTSTKVTGKFPEDNDPDLFPDADADRSISSEVHTTRSHDSGGEGRHKTGQELFATPLASRREKALRSSESNSLASSNNQMTEHCRIKKIRRITIESDSSDGDENLGEVSENLIGKIVHYENNKKTSSEDIRCTPAVPAGQRRTSRKSCVPNRLGFSGSPRDTNFDENGKEDLHDLATRSNKDTSKLQKYDDPDLFSGGGDSSTSEDNFAGNDIHLITPSSARDGSTSPSTPRGLGDKHTFACTNESSGKAHSGGTTTVSGWDHFKSLSWGGKSSQPNGCWRKSLQNTNGSDLEDDLFQIDEMGVLEISETLPISSYRNPSCKKAKNKAPEGLVDDETPVPIFEDCTDQFILKDLFGSRNVMIRKEKNKTKPIQTEWISNNTTFQLVATKLEKPKKNGKSSQITTPDYIKTYYVKGSPPSVQKRLEGWANFSELWDKPGKLASRMELLVSPACRGFSVGGKKKACLFKMNAKDFEVLNTNDFPENKTMGCGFIPKNMLVSLLGGGAHGEDANAVQARVLSPKHGLFKGMLVRKDDINKIQLPLSMRKVGKAQHQNTDDEKVYLLFNNVCPSIFNKNLERHINPSISQKPTKAATNDLQGFTDPINKLLLQCGVDPDVLDEYNECNAKTWEGLGHTSLYGVCDSTKNGLPDGSVFIPGLFPYNRNYPNKKVLITRSPCTDENDLAILPVVTEKPRNMSAEIWKDLCDLPLGVIMFASPQDHNTKSLPELVNNSDLDGDKFCVIWDENILSCLKNKNMKPGREARCPAATTYNAGDVIEVEEDDKYYPAEIRKVCLDNGHETCTIMFDDGEILEAVTLDRIRKLDQAKITRKDTITTRVFAHRGSGKTLEVEVELDGSGKKQWKRKEQFQGLYEVVLAQYAIENELLDRKDWKFAKKYVRDAKMVFVQNIEYTSNHEAETESCKATVVYDDGSSEKIDTQEIDIDLLSRYYEERSESIPPAIDERMKKEQTEWFKVLQEKLADSGSLHAEDLLRTRLYSQYRNKEGTHCASDVQAFGNAFKVANDLGKHGGRVPLPEHLRDIIVGKKDRLHDLLADA